MRNWSFKTILLTLIAAFLIVFIIGFIIVYGGFISIAASNPPSAIESWFMHFAMERSVKYHAGHNSMDLASSDRVGKGALLYNSNCVFCHTGPGVGRSPIGSGLNPFPPKLDRIKDEFNDHELFWIIKHGIKMTGMPTFIKSLSDDQLWDLVSFLNQLPVMSEPEFKQLIQSVGEKEYDFTSIIYKINEKLLKVNHI